MGRLAGQSILVTGASSGIGEAIVRRLAAEGASLTIVARREDRLASLAASLGEAQVACCVADVSRREEVKAAADLALQRFGRIDAIINNAGIMPASPLSEGRVEDWDRMIDVNLRGVLYGIDAVLGHMLARGSGDIINVSSVAAFKFSSKSAVYSATKAAVRALSESLRQETSGKVRVTVIYPGAVATELAHSIPDPSMREAMVTGLAEIGLRPEALADLVCYVLSCPPEVALNEVVIRPSTSP
jgi:NADP-dependent 3-hydroxy acid dehydrogenase YdfG